MGQLQSDFGFIVDPWTAVARVPPCQRAETGQRAVAAAAGDPSIRRFSSTAPMDSEWI